MYKIVLNILWRPLLILLLLLGTQYQGYSQGISIDDDINYQDRISVNDHDTVYKLSEVFKLLKNKFEVEYFI